MMSSIEELPIDPLALELERVANALAPAWRRLKDLEGNLNALAARSREGETLPEGPLAAMLRRHADMLSDRVNDLHALARQLK